MLLLNAGVARFAVIFAGDVPRGLHHGQGEGEQDPQHRGTGRRAHNDGAGKAGETDRRRSPDRSFRSQTYFGGGAVLHLLVRKPSTPWLPNANRSSGRETKQLRRGHIWFCVRCMGIH